MKPQLEEGRPLGPIEAVLLGDQTFAETLGLAAQLRVALVAVEALYQVRCATARRYLSAATAQVVAGVPREASFRLFGALVQIVAN